MSSARIEELEREIEGTRQELDRTLQALRNQFSLRHHLDAAWQSVRTGACWSIDHPARALLAAAAITGALCFGIVKLKPPRA